LKTKEVLITLDINLGEDEATAWGCDLTPSYITINSQDTT